MLICPICKKELIKQDRCLKCVNKHSFDISKKNYVNLLMSQATVNKQHGDDKIMLKARKAFLNKGYFKVLADKISEIVINLNMDNLSILDAGAGEGYYSSKLNSFLEDKVKAEFFCLDISKDALSLCEGDFNKIVASIYNLPIKDSSIDIILNIFAPLNEDEFLRTLKAKGYLIKVIPLEKHLFKLKEFLYPNPYLNQAETPILKGFKLLNSYIIKEDIYINNNVDIINLFKMTPYYYKTPKSEISKLDNLNFFDTQIEFGIYLYKKEIL